MNPIPTDITLVELFKVNIQQQKTITFITGTNKESEMTFQELYQESIVLLRHLQAKGISRGDKLVLFLKNNQLFVQMFWACLLGGIIPVPVAQGHSQEHLNKLLNIIEQLETCHFFMESDYIERLNTHLDETAIPALKQQIISKILTPKTLTGSTNEFGIESPHELDELAFIQYSSGSTNQPKGVLLTHRNLITTISDMANRVSFKENWTGLSWMPLTHDMGLIGYHLFMVARGVDHHIMDTNLFTRRPLAWLQKISEKRANIICSPNFGFKHLLKALHRSPDVNFDLSCVKGLICGAEPISAQLVNDFVNQLRKFGFSNKCIRPSYGLAEAGLAVSISNTEEPIKTISLDREHLNIGEHILLTENPNKSSVFTLLGTPLDMCQVRIVDDSGNILDENYVGELEIKGNNVTQGYFMTEGVNRDVITNDGWLKTGDLGLFHSGEVVITGRMKDIIIVEGQNYYSHDLENIIETAKACSLGEVAACAYRDPNDSSDKIIIFMRHRGKLSNFIDKSLSIKKIIFQTTGLKVFDVIPIRQVPKTTSGKFRRYILADAYAKGEFSEVLHEIQNLSTPKLNTNADKPSDEEISQTLLGFLHDVLGNPDICLSDNLFDLGANSMQLVALGEQLNSKYPDCIDVTDFYDCDTVKSLIDLITSRLPGSTESAA